MRLRPHASSELVDAALRIYQRQGMRMLRLTALPTLFCLASLTFLLDYILPAFTTTKNADSLGGQALEVVFTVCLGLFVAGPLFLTGLTYASTLVVRLAADDLEGMATSENSVLRFARSALPRLFVQNLKEVLLSASGILVAVGIMLLGSLLTTLTPSDSPVAGLVAVLGFLGLGVGGLIFLYVLSLDALVVPVTVLESETGRAVSKRSRSLLGSPKHRMLGAPIGSGYGPIWNVYLASLFIFFASFFGLKGIDALLDLQVRLTAWLGSSILKGIFTTAVQMVPLYIALWLCIPIWATAITVIYFERRVRLEGLDILKLSEEIEEGSASRFNV
jgi:hypothetical protein